MLVLTQLAQGGAATQGIEIPPILIPPLDKLQPHMTPAMSVTWTDETGWHQKSVTPFPGASILGSQQSLLLGQSALMTSVLLPSLSKARETANRVKCGSNLRQIGMGCLIYANDHNGKLPPDQGTLLKEADLTLPVFLCPSGNTTVPPEVLAGNLDAKATWVNQHSDYVYLGAGKTQATANAETVIAYEKDNHHNDGMNMLFGDGHVEYLHTFEAQRRLADQKAK